MKGPQASSKTGNQEDNKTGGRKKRGQKGKTTARKDAKKERKKLRGHEGRRQDRGKLEHC